MTKRYTMIGLAGVLMSAQLFAGTASGGQATPSQQELINEIEMLKNIVMDLNDRLVSAEEMLNMSLEMKEEQDAQVTEVMDVVDEIDERLGDAEKHTAMDRITMGVELETQFNSIHMDVKTMPMATQIQIGQMAMAGSRFSAADMEQYKAMFRQQGAEKQSISNDALFTSRIRLDLKAKPTRSLSFVGRLHGWQRALQWKRLCSSCRTCIFYLFWRYGRCGLPFLFRSPPRPRRYTYRIQYLQYGWRVARGSRNELAI